MSCSSTSTGVSSLRSATTRTATAMWHPCLRTLQPEMLSPVLFDPASPLTLSSLPSVSVRSRTGWRSRRWPPSRRARRLPRSARRQARWLHHVAHLPKWAPSLRYRHTLDVMFYNYYSRERTTRIYGGCVRVSSRWHNNVTIPTSF